jgi:tRNA threonylcarbamoyl adenosine modification protein YeaZ
VILGVDTSLAIFSAALAETDRTIAAVALEGKESRNEKLLPAIDWMLSESGSERGAIDLLAVTRGPGSFTGVRVGLATVEGLSLALDLPICAVSTHHALAAPTGRCAVVADAGRGEFYVSGFDGGREVLPAELATAQRRAEIEREFGRTILVEQALREVNVALRAGFLAAALRERGELETYNDVSPIYVRLAEAEARLRVENPSS